MPITADGDAAVIDERRPIAALLGRILHARTLLTLTVGRVDVSTSLLLEVAPLQGYVLLDAPFPAISPALLAPQQSIRVSGHLENGHFWFRTTVDGSSLSSSGELLQLRFPEELHYRERRNGFRVSIPPLRQLPPSEFGSDDLRFRSPLADISRGGAGTVVGRDNPAQPGTELPCLLRLPNLNIEARAEVRSRRELAGRLRLGLRLIDLSPAQDAQLSAEINALQRATLRRRS